LNTDVKQTLNALALQFSKVTVVVTKQPFKSPKVVLEMKSVLVFLYLIPWHHLLLLSLSIEETSLTDAHHVGGALNKIVAISHVDAAR